MLLHRAVTEVAPQRAHLVRPFDDAARGLRAAKGVAGNRLQLGHAPGRLGRVGPEEGAVALPVHLQRGRRSGHRRSQSEGRPAGQCRAGERRRAQGRLPAHLGHLHAA